MTIEKDFVAIEEIDDAVIEKMIDQGLVIRVGGKFDLSDDGYLMAWRLIDREEDELDDVAPGSWTGGLELERVVRVAVSYEDARRRTRERED